MICIGRGDASSQDSRGSKRGQGNFKLAANFGYSSRGSADPRESLRKRRILKLALSAHKVFAEVRNGKRTEVYEKRRILKLFGDEQVDTWGKRSADVTK